MSSLYVEVLAHTTLPTNDTRPRALARFFQAAESQISAGLSDPARLCGPIQPDLDESYARECLANAADLAWEAVTSEADDREHDAVCAWRCLFGDEFPAPPNGCDGSQALVASASASFAVLKERPRETPRRVKNSPQG